MPPPAKRALLDHSLIRKELFLALPASLDISITSTEHPSVHLVRVGPTTALKVHLLAWHVQLDSFPILQEHLAALHAIQDFTWA